MTDPNQAPEPYALDPGIVQVALDPLNEGNMPSAERERAIGEAQRLALWDGFQNKKIYENAKGEAHWAAEFPRVFTFDGLLRGKFDDLPSNPAERTGAQQIASIGGNMGGAFTDVIIETDQREQFLIRKTSGDEESANKQTFDLISTGMAERAARNGENIKPRVIDTMMLAGVVVVPGQPMRLGHDAQKGTNPRTQGNVTRITAIRRDDQGIVASGHPQLQRPDMRIDTPDRFTETIREIRRGIVGGAAGGAALGSSKTT